MLPLTLKQNTNTTNPVWYPMERSALSIIVGTEFKAERDYNKTSYS